MLEKRLPCAIPVLLLAGSVVLLVALGCTGPALTSQPAGSQAVPPSLRSPLGIASVAVTPVQRGGVSLVPRAYLPFVGRTGSPSITRTPTATSTPTRLPTATATATPSATSGSPATTTATPTLASPQSIGSIGMSLGTGDSAVLGRVKEAGMRWVRTSINWSDVEPADVDLSNPLNGHWPDDWFRILVNTYGFTPEVIVWKNPAWAASTSCGPINQLSAFGQFAHALAARYDGDGDYNNDGTADGPPLPEVRYFELYNEADFDLNNNNGEEDYGGCWGQAPAAYAEMLHTVYPAMKSGNPRVQVLFGSIAYDRFTAPSKPGWYPGPVGPFDYNFTRNVLTALYQQYAGDPNLPFFDVMNFHSYNDFRNAWDGELPYDQELIGKIKHIRDEQLVKPGIYDVRHLPFMSSEVGLPSAPTDQWTNRNESYQSDYVAQGFVQGMVAGLVANLWFTAQDYTQNGRCGNVYDWLMYGIVCSAPVQEASRRCSPNPLPDYTCPANAAPKPSYQAIKVLIQEMGGASYDRQLTPAETGAANIVAFRFDLPGGGKKVVVWTDTGERIGAKGAPPQTAVMTFSASHFGGQWTGRLRVADKLGIVAILSGGSSIAMEIGQGPRYVEVAP